MHTKCVEYKIHACMLGRNFEKLKNSFANLNFIKVGQELFIFGLDHNSKVIVITYFRGNIRKFPATAMVQKMKRMSRSGIHHSKFQRMNLFQRCFYFTSKLSDVMELLQVKPVFSSDCQVCDVHVHSVVCHYILLK